MQHLYVVAYRRARTPTKAKPAEEGCMPGALQQAAGEPGCGTGRCNAEVVPGPCQTWGPVAWQLRPYVWLSWDRNKNGPVVLEASLCLQALWPVSCPHTVSDSICLLRTGTIPSSFSSKHRNQDKRFPRAGFLCSGEACSLAKDSVSYGQGCWAGLAYGPQSLRNLQGSLELQPHISLHGTQAPAPASRVWLDPLTWGPCQWSPGQNKGNMFCCAMAMFSFVGFR